MNRSPALHASRAVSDVVSRIEAKSVDCPSKQAIYISGQSLTYGELWRRSAALASQLRAHGLGPEERAVVCLSPSLDAVVAILAVLRSGGAYIPIATDAPSVFIDQILADGKVKIVLSDLPSGQFKDTCVLAPQNWPHDAPAGYQDAEMAARHQLAYIIYTSGSTGKPKGVMVDHANLEYSLSARREVYGEGPYCALLLQPLAFDSSVAVFFPALCQGGTLIIASQAERRDSMALLGLIEEHSVSEILALPALYQTLLAAPGAPSKLSSLKRVILAGDRLSGAVVEQHFRVCPVTPLYNEYGPTEATVWSTVHCCDQADAEGPVPIGTAIPGTSVYVLHPQTLTQVRAGVEGEIFIGGPGVSRGYLQDSKTTALSFLPDAGAEDPGQRLYRTGDRGRMNEAGTLEFIGRIDHQVKIRGHRVALGYVEEQLNNYPDIQVVGVVLRRLVPWKGQLVAFFESENPRIDLQQLRTFLSQRLPDYMLPVAYVQLPVLPRTSNGKLDRSRMASLEIQQIFLHADYVPPRTMLEEQLCGIWCEVLKVPRVSVFDSYMDFGADSIAAMQFTTAARNHGIALLVTDVFMHRTIAELASSILERELNGTTSSSEPFDLPSAEGPFYRRTAAEDR